MAILATTFAGCWEEIHYSPPPATADVAQLTPPPSAEPTGNFADEVATSLAEEPASAPGETASAVGEPSQPDAAASTQDIVSTEPIAPATESTDNRYGGTPPESEPISTVVEPATPPNPDPITEPVAEPSTNSAPPTTEVTAEPATPAPPANPSRSPRRIAWLLGSNLSLAVLGNDRAVSEDRVHDWFDKSRRLAALVNINVADLPPRPAAGAIDPAANNAMEYLFDQSQTIGRQLAAQNGDDCAALFELAQKSNMLLVNYEPQARVVKALAAAISQAGERAKLPPELYQPLLELLAQHAPAKDVRNAVFDMHANIDRYLSTAHP